MSDAPAESLGPDNGMKPALSIPLLVVFGVLMLCALPILPIYLWRKGRLSGPVGIGLAAVWFAGYLALGATADPPKPDPVESTATVAVPTPRESETSKPSPATTTEPSQRPKPSPTTQRPKPTPTRTSTKPKPKDPCAGISKSALKDKSHVFKCQFGAKWPLTVAWGVVVCVDKPHPRLDLYQLTFITSDTDERPGEEYALNGTALSAGYPEIDPIWRDDPEIPGAKVNIEPLMDRARAVCD